MKFFQKRGVAITLMVLAIVGAVVIGQVRRPPAGEEPSTSIVGEYTYTYDYSGVLSESTMEHVDAMNRSLFAQTGAQILIQVVDSTKGQDIAEYAIDLGNDYGVGSAERDNGIVLVLALENMAANGLVGDYWLEPGLGFTLDEADRMLDILYGYLEAPFAAGDYDAGVRETFDELAEYLEELYGVTVKENYIPAVRENFTSRGGGYRTQTLGVVPMGLGDILWGMIVLAFVLLILWIIVDGIRWSGYRRRYLRPGMGVPTVTYYPVFWGRPRRPRIVVTRTPPPRTPRPPRSPRPPMSSGGSFGGGRSSGRSSFGGGSFGSRGSSFGGGRRGGRSSFGGGRSSGRSSFGGGSFGGSRGGGRGGFGGGRGGGRR